MTCLLMTTRVGGLHVRGRNPNHHLHLSLVTMWQGRGDQHQGDDKLMDTCGVDEVAVAVAMVMMARKSRW